MLYCFSDFMIFQCAINFGEVSFPDVASMIHICNENTGPIVGGGSYNDFISENS